MCLCVLFIKYSPREDATLRKLLRTSLQDGFVGRYTLPPCTTKRRTTTNLKTKNNQNCQKIELFGSPTTKELKKNHSPTLVGGAEMGSWGREDAQQGGGWRKEQSHIACGKAKKNYWGARQTGQLRVPALGNKASKTSD